MAHVQLVIQHNQYCEIYDVNNSNDVKEHLQNRHRPAHLAGTDTHRAYLIIKGLGFGALKLSEDLNLPTETGEFKRADPVVIDSEWYRKWEVGLKEIFEKDADGSIAKFVALYDEFAELARKLSENQPTIELIMECLERYKPSKKQDIQDPYIRGMRDMYRYIVESFDQSLAISHPTEFDHAKFYERVGIPYFPEQSK